MEDVTLIKDWLTIYGPLGIGWVVAGFLIWHVMSDRKKPNGIMGDLRQHREMTAQHFAVLEDRVSENYEEFLRFKVEIAAGLATRAELDKVESRIKEHVGAQVQLILDRLPK